MGSTGNVYTVSIKEIPTCTCPYNKQRYTRCKHIFFVLIKIIKIPTNLENKLRFDDDDLLTLFDNFDESKISNDLLCTKNAITKYDSIINNKQIRNDVCPICLDPFNDNDKIIKCRSGCNNGIHQECLDEANKYTNNKDICTMCSKNLFQIIKV